MEPSPHKTIPLLSGVTASFPHDPYPQQIEYMKSVVDACESGRNAMLESPTGTGKTMALLCAALSWQKKKAEEDKGGHTIFYASRTHAQLAQVRQELKKSVYRPVNSVLASKERCCIYKNVPREKGQTLEDMCKNARRKGLCPSIWNLDDPRIASSTLAAIEEMKVKIKKDLEDIGKMCKENGVCAFYFAKELAKEADIVFLPYNYLITRKLKYVSKGLLIDKKTGMNKFSGSIVIIDEGHNIANAAETNNGMTISVVMLHECIRELDSIRQELKKHNEEKKSSSKAQHVGGGNSAGFFNLFTDSDIAQVQESITAFLEYLVNAEDTSKVVARIDEFFTLCSRPLFTTRPHYFEDGINSHNCAHYLKLLNIFIEIMKSRNVMPALQKWEWCIYSIFMLYSDTESSADHVNPIIRNCKGSINDFRASIYHKPFSKKPRKKLVAKTPKKVAVKIHCFNPGIGFIDLLLLQPPMRTLIVTSGTLSPMSELEKELRLPFPIKLDSPHVISDSQILLLTVGHADIPSETFKFNMERNMSSEGPVHLHNAQKLISDICDISPGGVLSFYSSYAFKTLASSGVKPGDKVTFRESKGVDTKAVIAEFKKVAKSGAILHAVLRGIVSEGLGFADDEARVAIVLGIPYANLANDHITLKREYMDKNFERIGLSGFNWYRQDAMRAINQAVGRIIRHKNDYGAVVLVDERFCQREIYDELPKWMTRGGKREDLAPADCLKRLREFFGAWRERDMPSKEIVELVAEHEDESSEDEAKLAGKRSEPEQAENAAEEAKDKSGS